METLDRVLDLVVREADSDRALRAGRGKGKLQRVLLRRTSTATG